MSELAKAIGARVREARGELSQTELAVRAGMTQPTIWRIEHGENTPTVANLIALAQALGCEIHWLVTGESGELEESSGRRRGASKG